jgi:hypothetical protein
MRGPTVALPLLLLVPFLWACEPMESSGHIFTPAQTKEPTLAVAPDPALAFPTEEKIKLSSEQLAAGTTSPADAGKTLAAAAGVDPSTLPAEPEVADAAPVPTPASPAPDAATALPPVGLPSSPWPVRLLSTIPQAQPPRAVIGLPSGEEKVVSPGSILADQGLVVMSVTADRVQLAKIEAAGDHANIQTLDVAAQYPAAH